MQETTTRLNLLKHLRSVNRQFMKVMMPAELYNDLHIFVEMCAYNGINVPRFFSYVFNIGYELFSSYYHQGNMKSLSEMIVITKYMHKMFREVLQYQGREWFLNPEAVISITKLCRKHNKDIQEFFSFIDTHKQELLGVDNFLITKVKAEAIFEIFIQGNL